MTLHEKLMDQIKRSELTLGVPPDSIWLDPKDFKEFLDEVTKSLYGMSRFELEQMADQICTFHGIPVREMEITR